MSSVDESDEVLMRRVRSNGRDSMSVLVRRFADPLLTFIRRLGVPNQLADEVFQEVFLAVWIHRQKFQMERNFRSWLFGIAANKCRAALRQHRRTENIDADFHWTGVGAAPVEDLIQTETAVMVESAIAQLPLRQREVVVMRLLNEMSYEEIAAALKRSESTVRTNMSLGLYSLREYLEPRMRE